jgi:hypothetical protein
MKVNGREVLRTDKDLISSLMKMFTLGSISMEHLMDMDSTSGNQAPHMLGNSHKE